MMTAIMHYDKEALSSMLQTEPATFLTLLNALCRMTDSALELEN